MVDEPLLEQHRARLDVEAGGQLMDQASPNRLGRLPGLEPAMPLLTTLAVGSTRQINDHVPEGRGPTVLAGVDSLVDVTLHQRVPSRP